MGNERGAAGIFRAGYGPDVRVESPGDLVRNGIYVSSEAVRHTWGQEGVRVYEEAMAQQRASKRYGSPISV